MANNIGDEKRIRFENDISKHIIEIDCDTPVDLPEPDAAWLMGSIAPGISTGDFYELSSSGEWGSQTGDAS